jgi:hypothetical protein
MKRPNQIKAARAPAAPVQHSQRKEIPGKEPRVSIPQNPHGDEKQGKAILSLMSKGKKRFPFEIFTAGHVKRLVPAQDQCNSNRETLRKHGGSSFALLTPTPQSRPAVLPQKKFDVGSMTNLPSPTHATVPSTCATSPKEPRPPSLKNLVAGSKAIPSGRAALLPQVQTLQQLLHNAHKTPTVIKAVPPSQFNEKESGKDLEQSLLSSTQFIPMEGPSGGQKELSGKSHLRHKLETSRLSTSNQRLNLALVSNLSHFAKPGSKPHLKVTTNIAVDPVLRQVGKCVPCSSESRSKDKLTLTAKNTIANQNANTNISQKKKKKNNNSSKCSLKYSVVRSELETRNGGAGQTTAIKVRLPKGFVVVQPRPSSKKEEKTHLLLVSEPEGANQYRASGQKTRLDIGSAPMKKSVEEKAAQERAVMGSLREQYTATTAHDSSRSSYGTTHASKQSTQPDAPDDIGPMLLNRLADLRQARAHAQFQFQAQVQAQAQMQGQVQVQVQDKTQSDACRSLPEDLHYVTFGRDQFAQLSPSFI